MSEKRRVSPVGERMAIVLVLPDRSSAERVSTLANALDAKLGPWIASLPSPGEGPRH
jgi:hypothetical protein